MAILDVYWWFYSNHKFGDFNARMAHIEVVPLTPLHKTYEKVSQKIILTFSLQFNTCQTLFVYLVST